MNEVAGKITGLREFKTKTDKLMHAVNLDDGWEKGYTDFGGIPSELAKYKEDYKTVIVSYEESADGKYRNKKSVRVKEYDLTNPPVVKPFPKEISIEYAPSLASFKGAGDLSDEDTAMDGFVMEVAKLKDKLAEAGIENEDLAKLFATYQMSDHKKKQRQAVLGLARNGGKKDV